MRGAPLHDQVLQKVKDLGANEVRYTGAGYLFPHFGVAELEPPTATKTSWDFSYIDPVTEDALKALAGHSVVLNFTTIPAWMFKTAKPVGYPADPTKPSPPTRASAEGFGLLKRTCHIREDVVGVGADKSNCSDHDY